MYTVGRMRLRSSGSAVRTIPCVSSSIRSSGNPYRLALHGWNSINLLFPSSHSIVRYNLPYNHDLDFVAKDMWKAIGKFHAEKETQTSVSP